jgi:hypothetical protein
MKEVGRGTSLVPNVMFERDGMFHRLLFDTAATSTAWRQDTEKRLPASGLTHKPTTKHIPISWKCPTKSATRQHLKLRCWWYRNWGLAHQIRAAAVDGAELRNWFLAGRTRLPRMICPDLLRPARLASSLRGRYCNSQERTWDVPFPTINPA